MKTASGRRHFTYLRGRNAEWLALAWLMLKGYRPLGRRYAVAGGVSKVVPVDLHVRGCPPSPVEILKGLIALLDD